MSRTPVKSAPAVPAEEVERRLAEYRRLSFAGQAPAQVVYQEPHIACPWSGCGLRIAGIRFSLEKLGDAGQASQWLAAWWNGPGLVGRCPKCNRHVLFEITGKQAVTELAMLQSSLLPHNWHETGCLVTRHRLAC
jgi:hypothetical protein